MHRRALLSAVGAAGAAALGGCLAAVGIGTGDPANPVDDERRISLLGVDPVPDESGVTIDVRVLDDRITASETAEIVVETTVVGDATALPVTQGSCAILNRRTCSSAPRGLWLESTDKSGSTATPHDEGWMRRGLPTGEQGFGGYGCRRVEYQPGESVRNTYEIWDDGRVDGYLEPGEYRWADTISTRAASSEGEEYRSFDWGFSLELSREES
ncbi:hypothetical protein [Haloarchaeobius iranensis]|uniref:Uncharacterized protein n=1 Tax=Haloarchaeobius iranensis TaxID=996166 RepID=A0A1G9UUA5_9EURY|nr:hypothetical protein [Haloarchaeobius iranensis]SDM63521.1 hypothetical protein SAMN05192554_1058 [Haloarchaeobius iranensis]